MADWNVEVINGKEYWVRTSDSGNKIVFGEPMEDMAKAQAEAIKESLTGKDAMDRIDDMINASYEKERKEIREREELERNLKANEPQWNENNSKEDDFFIEGGWDLDEIEKANDEYIKSKFEKAEEKYMKDCMNRALQLLENAKENYMKKYSEFHGNTVGLNESMNKIKSDCESKVRDTFGEATVHNEKGIEYLAEAYNEASDKLRTKVIERDVHKMNQRRNSKFGLLVVGLLVAGIVLGLIMAFK